MRRPRSNERRTRQPHQAESAHQRSRDADAAGVSTLCRQAATVRRRRNVDVRWHAESSGPGLATGSRSGSADHRRRSTSSAPPAGRIQLRPNSAPRCTACSTRRCERESSPATGTGSPTEATVSSRSSIRWAMCPTCLLETSDPGYSALLLAEYNAVRLDPDPRTQPGSRLRSGAWIPSSLPMTTSATGPSSCSSTVTPSIAACGRPSWPPSATASASSPPTCAVTGTARSRRARCRWRSSPPTSATYWTARASPPRPWPG